MPHEPSASFPTSIDAPVTDAPASDGRDRLVRVVLLGWAGAVYVFYWLGYLGAR